MSQKFETGVLVATPTALETFDDLTLTICYLRHCKGDWGNVDNEDWRKNNHAVASGQRILSEFAIPFEGGEVKKLWIITEADRSTTTVLLPSEY